MAFNGRGWYVITPAGPAGPYKSKSDAMSSAAALRYVVRYLSATDGSAGLVAMRYVWTHDWPYVEDTNPETDDEGRVMAPDSDDTWDFKRGD